MIKKITMENLKNKIKNLEIMIIKENGVLILVRNIKSNKVEFLELI